jgi:hypothetical protein
MNAPAEPSQLLDGMTERQMLNLMERFNIACRVEAFRSACREVQDAALRAQRERALDRLVADAQELGFYDMENNKCLPQN